MFQARMRIGSAAMEQVQQVRVATSAVNVFMGLVPMIQFYLQMFLRAIGGYVDWAPQKEPLCDRNSRFQISASFGAVFILVILTCYTVGILPALAPFPSIPVNAAIPTCGRFPALWLSVYRSCLSRKATLNLLSAYLQAY
jgi:hypothetical protein